MRTIIIFLAIALAQTAAYGQADDLLDRAAQACLSIRQAVEERSADNVMLGMEKLEELPFSNLTLTDVDTGGEASLRGHLQYDMQYLDSLLICDLDMSLIQVDGPFVLRNPKAKILCTHRAVKAQSAVTYSMSAQGRQSLVVVLTQPETAQSVARVIDEARLDHVLGTVAGHDTVFVAADSPAGADEVRNAISALATSG